MTPEEIDKWVERREQSRRDRQYDESDRIRRFLLEHGVIVEDKKDGTSRWRFE
jgi:cysteinyl-tRNA synthetase